MGVDAPEVESELSANVGSGVSAGAFATEWQCVAELDTLLCAMEPNAFAETEVTIAMVAITASDRAARRSLARIVMASPTLRD